MSIYVSLLISLFALIAGYFLGTTFSKVKTKAQADILGNQLTALKEQIQNLLKERTDLEARHSILQSEKETLNLQWTRLNAEYENLFQNFENEKLRFKEFEKEFSDKFENLAHRIITEKTEKFTAVNKDNIANILKPLNEKIKDFEEKVGKTNDDFNKGHAALGKQLELLNQQNLKISEEANNLTKALKGDSKTQGNWGELILERVLERSNLVKDREYFVQKTYTTEDGQKMLPDVVVHLPNDKRMIIDAKVSLRAYEKYCNEEDAKQKQTYLNAHIKALKDHIQTLSAKRYEDLMQGYSPDFVLLFIPIEPALYIAQEQDNAFFFSAFQRNILLVSPTTLLSTLRTIDALWSNEKQHQNAQDIARHAASLYHKFKNLLDDLETVGNRLSSTQSAYDMAMKKLSGNQNLIKDIDKLEKLGVSPKQRIASKWLENATENDD